MQRSAGTAASRQQPTFESAADASFPLAALRHIFGRPVEPAQLAAAAATAAVPGSVAGTAAPDARVETDVAAPAKPVAFDTNAVADENHPSEPRPAGQEVGVAADADLAEGESQAKAVHPTGPDKAHTVAESAPADAGEAGLAATKTCSGCAAAVWRVCSVWLTADFMAECLMMAPRSHFPLSNATLLTCHRVHLNVVASSPSYERAVSLLKCQRAICVLVFLRCKITKPKTEYWKHARNPDGVQSRCIACLRLRSRRHGAHQPCWCLGGETCCAWPARVAG